MPPKRAGRFAARAHLLPLSGREEVLAHEPRTLSSPYPPPIEKAINELQGMISERFPQASFVVEEGFDPKGIYLVTTVDIADTDEVMDVVGDRLVELQVDGDLPIYVTPLRPIQRVVAELREREHAMPPSPLPLP